MLRRGIGLCAVLWCFLSLRAEARSQADGLCLAKKCGLTMVQCGVERECREWLQCVLACGDDKVRCPSICGFTFQSAHINKTNQCIFESDCVELGFDQLPAYEHGDKVLEPLAGLQGRYWFAASSSASPIFDLECQSFDFVPDPQDAKRLGVHFAVPVAKHGTSSLRAAEGSFVEQADGSIDVVYENFVGYHERWYILGRDNNSLLAHVCIAGEERCYDYGTVLLSRKPLADFDVPELASVEDLLHSQLGKSLGDFKPKLLSQCPNP